MKILVLTAICTSDVVHDVILGADTTLAGIHLGCCVADFSDEKKFVLESDDIDWESLSTKLVAARKLGQFGFWSLQWNLIDSSGVIINGGLVMEDEESGEIKNYTMSALRAAAKEFLSG